MSVLCFCVSFLFVCLFLFCFVFCLFFFKKKKKKKKKNINQFLGSIVFVYDPFLRFSSILICFFVSQFQFLLNVLFTFNLRPVSKGNKMVRRRFGLLFTCEAMYSRVGQVKFVEDSLSRPYPFKFFKGCLLQILLGPFLNTLS